MSGRLAGKIAVVTGAAQGIGAATARAFAQAGASVVLADLNVALAREVAAGIEAGDGTACALQADVTDPGAMEIVGAHCMQRHGRIDILVANAGVNVFSEPSMLTDADWRRCLAVDLDGVWHSIRAVLPAMRAQRSGSVVVMASCHSFQAIPNCFPYAVAKHGVIGLVRALGIQYAAEGLRVNAIAPGYIETQLALDHWATMPDPEMERKRAYALHPPGRIGTPEEVAMTAVFLASDEAPFINAATIVIDGGRSAVYHD